MNAGDAPRRIALYDAFANLEGSAGILLRIAGALDRERFELVGLLAREGPLQAALEKLDVPTEIFEPGGPLSVYGGRLMQAGPLRKITAAISLHRYSLAIERWLRERGVDLMHCNQTRAVMIAGPGARRANIPVVWNVLIRQSLPLAATMLAARASSRIVTNAPDGLDDFPMADALRAKTTFVPNGIDTDAFTPDLDGGPVRAELGIGPDDLMVLSAGVITHRKGHDLLVRAATAIIEQFPTARFVIAGGPPVNGGTSYADELTALAHSEGVADHVVFAGRRSDMPAVCAACDLFVLASRQEGSPTAVIEAMACECPVVVTPPAAAALTQPGVGAVVPADDPDALAAKVCELLADRTSARAMGAAARKHVITHHSVGTMVRGYEEVYSGLLQRK